MKRNEFEQEVILRYIGKWLESIEDSSEVVVYSEDDRENHLNRNAQEVILDAYDVAEAISARLLKTNPSFFD